FGKFVYFWRNCTFFGNSNVDFFTDIFTNEPIAFEKKDKFGIKKFEILTFMEKANIDDKLFIPPNELDCVSIFISISISFLGKLTMNKNLFSSIQSLMIG